MTKTRAFVLTIVAVVGLFPIWAPETASAQLFGGRDGGILNPLNILDPFNLLGGRSSNNYYADYYDSDCYNCGSRGGYNDNYYSGRSYGVPLFGASYSSATYRPSHNPHPTPSPTPHPTPTHYPTPSPYPYPSPYPVPYPVPQPYPQPYPVPQPYPQPYPVPQYYPEPNPPYVVAPQPQPIYIPQPQPIIIQQPQPIIIQQPQPIVISQPSYPVYSQPVYQYPNRLSVSCTPDVISSKSSRFVTWTARVYSGSLPYTYSWTGTETNNNSNSSSIYVYYQTYGQKFMSVNVRSADGVNATASCGMVNITP